MWRHPTADKWLLLPKSHDARASQDLICIHSNIQCVFGRKLSGASFHDKATSIEIEEELNTKRSYVFAGVRSNSTVLT